MKHAWLFIGLGIFFGCDNKKATTVGQIHGLVVADFIGDSAFDLAPVPGVVCVWPSSKQQAVTEATGEFIIKDVPAGTGLLVCSMEHESASWSVMITLEVIANKTNEAGALQLQPAGSIYGTATLQEQSDHSGIFVSIPGTSFSTTTEANGHFTLEKLPPGTTKLSFEKPGYVPIVLPQIDVRSGYSTAVSVLLVLVDGVHGAITINSGITTTLSRTVQVQLFASPTVSQFKLSENSGFAGADWQSMVTSISHTFTTDGSKTLYARFADDSGQNSADTQASILIDTTAPVITKVSYTIESKTSSLTNITLTVEAADTGTGVASLVISNDQAFADTQVYNMTTQVSPYEIPWSANAILSGATVYLKAKDLVGHESAVMQVGITPSIEEVFNQGVQYGRRYEGSKFFLPYSVWVGGQIANGFGSANTVETFQVIDPGYTQEYAAGDLVCTIKHNFVWDTVEGFGDNQRMAIQDTIMEDTCFNDMGLYHYIVEADLENWSYQTGASFWMWEQQDAANEARPLPEWETDGLATILSICLSGQANDIGYCTFVGPDYTGF